MWVFASGGFSLKVRAAICLAPNEPLVIDEIDLELLELLARRVEVAQRAARAKAKVGQPVRDPEREAELLLERQAKAEELGLDGLSTAEVFRAILGFSRLHQDEAGE